MSRKQELRSEETKTAILTAAETLFSKRGFTAVTMREIAKEAECSHTTIYIYFKDKEALLHQLSMPRLAQLQHEMASISRQNSLTPEDKLKGVSRAFIRFCLLNRDMYMTIFAAKAGRVDELDTELEINQLRNELFALLRHMLRHCLPEREDDERMLTFARIYFFTLQGIVATYTQSEEPLESIMARLNATYDVAVEVLLLGFKQKLENGGSCR